MTCKARQPGSTSLLLTPTNLPHYLSARGLVDPDHLIGGQFVVEEAGRRNRNFKVSMGRTGGLFVKQPRFLAPDAILTLQREAEFYRVANQLIAFSPLRQILPSLIDYNRLNHSLVLELLPGWENLNEHHARTKTCSAEAARSLGSAMGAYHAGGHRILTEPPDLSIFPRQIPWILTITPAPLMRGEGGFASAGPTFHALVSEFPGVMFQIAQLARHWRVDGLIHGDLKWDNILIDPSIEGQDAVRVVDWELADLGDAAWDVASVWSSYLTTWVFAGITGIWGTATPTAEEFSARLREMRGALLAFWEAYCSSAEIPAAESAAHRLRSLQFCGAKLAATAYECVHNNPGNLEPPRRLLRLASQILHHPLEASREIFGD
jgi:hypothetical protein